VQSSKRMVGPDLEPGPMHSPLQMEKGNEHFCPAIVFLETDGSSDRIERHTSPSLPDEDVLIPFFMYTLYLRVREQDAIRAHHFYLVCTRRQRRRVATIKSGGIHLFT